MVAGGSIKKLMLDELRQARQIVLFGGTAWLIDKYLPWLQGAGVEEKVLYVCDNDVVKHGSVINGYLIHPTNKILENPDATICILAGHTSAIYRSIRNAGIKNTIICAPHFRHQFTKPLDVQSALLSRKFVIENKSRLKSIYNQNDLYTERALKEIMRQRLLDSYAFVEPKSMFEFDTEENYFVDRSLAPLTDITFIDCGAYNGDSTSAIRRQFGKQLKKVIAFEPFPNSYRQLSLHLSTPVYGSVECVTINCGVGSKSATAFIEINLDPAANALTERGEGVPVEVRTIDSFNFDILGDAVLKLDVEGGELEALKGAKGFIQNHNPYIAICVYHKMEDILQLPEFIYSANKDYTFFLRGGVHTVCYAIPKRLFGSVVVGPPVA